MPQRPSVTVKVDTTELDAALEKAERLVELLKEVAELTGENAPKVTATVE